MAWKLHPLEQSVLRPAEQTTEYQIKFICQGNMLLSYLIGSWGLRTGSLRKSSDQFTSFSIIFVIHVSAFICSLSLPEKCFNAQSALMSAGWGSAEVLSLSLANTQLDMLQGLAWQTSRIIILLWGITKSLSYCFEDRKLLYASCSGDTIHNLSLSSPVLSQRF